LEYHILAINLGSTSTKLGLYLNDSCVTEENIAFRKTHMPERVHVLDEFDARMEAVRSFFGRAGISGRDVDIFVSRAGAPCPVQYGAYAIDKQMAGAICFADRPTYHASLLSVVIAYCLASEAGKPAIFYDAIDADQAPEIAHVSGIPGIRRGVGCHNLNTRMVGREVAERMGKAYEACRFVIAHLGGGMSVSAHDRGIIVDATTGGEGPMSPQRCGRMDFVQLVRMCFSGKYTLPDMQRLTDNGGLLSYLGAEDILEVEKRIAGGDEKAAFMYQAMAYQVCKAIGEYYAVLSDEADAVILTGGIAHSEMFTAWVKERVGRMAPVVVVPGEREMLALARGGLRVLRGAEDVKSLAFIPDGCENMDQLKAAFIARRPDLTGKAAVERILAL
jgi:butyrate kinase